MIDIIVDGLPPQEAVNRLMNGWVVVPHVKLRGLSVATLDNPNPTTQYADIWVLFPPGPTMPQVVVMDRMEQAADLYPQAEIALDWIATQLFNTTLVGIRAAMQAGREAVKEPDADV